MKKSTKAIIGGLAGAGVLIASIFALTKIDSSENDVEVVEEGYEVEEVEVEEVE